MKSKKIISLISAIALTVSLVVAFPVKVFAATSDISDPAKGTQTATPGHFVDASVDSTANTIAYDPLDVFGHKNTEHAGTIYPGEANEQKDAKFVMFNSLKDITQTTNKQIKFTEGATNANAYYTVKSSVPTGGDAKTQGIANWLYYTNSTSEETNAYVPATITGTLDNTNLTGYTLNDNETLIGVCKPVVKIFSYDGSGAKWNIPVDTTITIALVTVGSSGNKLYIGTGNDLKDTTGNFVKYSAIGDTASPKFCTGNNFVLTKVPSDMSASDKGVTLTFGYNSVWSLQQNSTNMNLATLIDLPESAASGNELKWDVTITGNYLSNP
ncbi:hypothetical protein NNC19_04000 [Clostridium sp. SHJSY1]|uniref:hypothetical protein n=1 Tax=Clostridium sp. SHJSY1 TaxID=2942483 RepID=UPI0028762273|nr:hypothetical protein [Clostridium sp. SHJSY1]MDS0524831.1 hypothetical protein [Clostridium sp. SHJSY1]